MRLINVYGSPVWYSVYRDDDELQSRTFPLTDSNGNKLAGRIDNGKDKEFSAGVHKARVTIYDSDERRLASDKFLNTDAAYISKTGGKAAIGGLPAEVSELFKLAEKVVWQAPLPSDRTAATGDYKIMTNDKMTADGDVVSVGKTTTEDGTVISLPPTDTVYAVSAIQFYADSASKLVMLKSEVQHDQVTNSAPLGEPSGDAWTNER